MRVLVWQWGRRGGAPRFAVELAAGFRMLPDADALLSLSSGAEILRGRDAPHCDLPVETYQNLPGYLWRLVQAPWIVRELARRIAALRPDIAIAAHPGPFDLVMLAALRRNQVRVVVVVHDADAHPGDGMPMRLWLQRKLIRRADAVVALSDHVATRLREQGAVDRGRLITLSHPPFTFDDMPPPRAHGGPVRLLFFGRLLAYKGLDLLADAMAQLRARNAWELRIVGSGPEAPELDKLRTTAGVTVENRWVPEDEIGKLIAWADVVLLPYREASQSGVGPAAIGAGRSVVGTKVGGLIEQLQNAPQATLSEPDAASFAAALSDIIDEPHDIRPCGISADPRHAWRDMAQEIRDHVLSLSTA
jgi:glycosyltransferase involved in cell wall biosynthesis